jgi:DNA-binding winged helix-turn-helix (wHTH) protein
LTYQQPFRGINVSERRVIYEFGGFRLDPHSHQLIVVDGERPVSISARSLDTLLYFAEHRVELLEKSVLMNAIWPTVVVEENSLNQHICALRRALGERPDEHRFFMTVAGRGYRFVAEVKVVPAGSERSVTTTAAQFPTQGSQRLGRATATAPAGSAAERTSIAVLPFDNLTGDPAKDYFGFGMAEELVISLARIPQLKVPSRTSSFAYRDRNLDVTGARAR